MDTTSDLICRRRRRPVINIVPLVDVLTVLLFFFLVTMQFKQVSSLNIMVPKIETAGENVIEEQIVIAVSPEGEFYLNNRAVEKAVLTGPYQGLNHWGCQRPWSKSLGGPEHTF